MKFNLNDTVEGTRNFSWDELLWLPKWQLHAFPPANVQDELIKITYKLQQIRNIFGQPIKITSGYRPKLYNSAIGGAEKSLHQFGQALDFTIEGLSCAAVRAHLVPMLDDLKIRMENKPDSTWVHIDHKDPGISGRYFNP